MAIMEYIAYEELKFKEELIITIVVTVYYLAIMGFAFYDMNFSKNA